MKKAVTIPAVGDVGALVDLAVELEETGWDGVFLWDHLQVFPDQQLSWMDPWVLLGAIATATERVRLGTMVTPISRRRPWKLAKEAVTLDHLSAGRVILGAHRAGRAMGRRVLQPRDHGHDTCPDDARATYE